MLKVRRHVGVFTAVLALMLVAAACSSDDGGSDGSGSDVALTGSITISGSSTVLPISNLVAEAFNGENPEVAISVDGPGTGDGFVLFCDGQIDISDASRAIEEEEVQLCSDAGINYVELAVAFDGITVMTNPANSAVSCLNTGDLYALFGPESTGIDNWSDADQLATAVGGNGDFPDQSLDVTAPGRESGTYDAFIDLAGIEDTALEQGVPEEEAAALREDYQSSPDDNVIIQAMEGSPGALGFVGFAYAEGAASGVKVVQVDAGDGCVEPSRDTIADGSYPLSRTLYIYVNTDMAKSKPELAAFVDFYVSDAGIKTAVSDAGYVDLPDEVIDATRTAWDGAAV